MSLIAICLITGALVFIILIFLFGMFVLVQEKNAAVIERFGKFHKIVFPGLNFKMPLIDSVRSTMDMRVTQLVVDVETKTKDNVFAKVKVCVQYQVVKEKIYEANYKLEDPQNQIISYVFDVVRSSVPLMLLDDVFENKEKIALAIKEELKTAMDDFGYEIIQALVVDIDPDANVKSAMNEINAAQRMRVAAQEKGEAEKVLAVKKAEAESASKILQGQGIAGQRKAIIDGLKSSVEDMKKATGAKETEVMSMILMTQYFDTLKEIGSGGKVVFVEHSPGAVTNMRQQLLEAMSQ